MRTVTGGCVEERRSGVQVRKSHAEHSTITTIYWTFPHTIPQCYTCISTVITFWIHILNIQFELTFWTHCMNKQSKNTLLTNIMKTRSMNAQKHSINKFFWTHDCTLEMNIPNTLWMNILDALWTNILKSHYEWTFWKHSMSKHAECTHPLLCYTSPHQL